MPFLTKLDFSDNRQVKQHVETRTELSGATAFGVPFSALTTGLDLSTSGISQTYSLVTSSFSGNSGTTVYSWYDTRMSLGESYLSAITPSNSGSSQSVIVFTASTTTVIDGNTVILTYTGVSFSIVVTGMTDLGGGNYSGNVLTNSLKILSADTLDFTGRTIWVDVSGITRTENLIVTNNPVIGYVLTCIDNEGRVEFQPSSGGTSGTTHWSASTGSNAIVQKYSNSTASGILSLAEGGQTKALGDYSHAEGGLTTASGLTSHAEGYQSKANGNFSHAEGNSTMSNGLASHAEGSGTTALGNYSHSEGGSSTSGISGSTASGNYSHAEGDGTSALGEASHSEGYQTTASGNYSHSEGQYTTAYGDNSHAGGYQSIASGQTSFVHGSGSTAGGVNTIVLGANITGLTSNTTYVNSLNIKTVGAGPGITDIGVDANGNVVDQASDFRLKENINTIKSALEIVLSLRGVTYNWKDREKGGDAIKLGFIAQEVKEIIPELTYYNPNGDYMGVHYKDITALLVEAIKELTSGDTKYGNSYLETQTILAEDNNIDLNYSGSIETAIGGGIRVLNALGVDKSAEFITDKDGNWVTNNNFKPKSISLPIFTPISSNDSNGSDGNITRDDNFLYVKINGNWKRSNLESF